MSNTLKQVWSRDLFFLKLCISRTVTWYISHSDDLDRISEFFQEDNEDLFKDILDKGLTEMQNLMEIMKEAKRGDEL